VLIFALVARTLAAVGTYGVLAYMVEMRTREIDVRMALGAQAREVLRMVLAQGAWLVGIGLLLQRRRRDRPAQGPGERPVRSVSHGPAVIFAVVFLVLSLMGLAACYLPARRATRVDPLVALRAE
jgi:putative ABC transport system permease protein